MRANRDLAVELVSFQGMPVNESEPVVEVAGLLIYAKRSPEMQMFADCALAQEGDQHLLRSFAPPALPFNITIMERPSRLATSYRVCVNTVAFSIRHPVSKLTGYQPYAVIMLFIQQQ